MLKVSAAWAAFTAISLGTAATLGSDNASVETAQIAQAEAPSTPMPVTLANSETFRVTSKHTGGEHLIKVAYPRNYHQTDKRYPVVYATDAETNFGAMQYVVQRLAKDKLMPEVILVGIAYDVDYDTFYKLRERDLRPAWDESFGASPEQAAQTKGKAHKFSAFLREELIPQVDTEFRTVEGDRAVYGHSYGGLYGTYAFLYQSDLFNRYLILSPSLWWPWDENRENILVDSAATLDLPERDARVFMGSGELEGQIDTLQTKFADRVRPNLDPSVNLRAEVYDNETHRTIYGRGVMDGFRYLYEE
ncbi:alpha/beta hydrolase [Erythrobacter sp. HA6-11]